MPLHPRIRLRRATPDDVPALLAVREASFMPGPMFRALWGDRVRTEATAKKASDEVLKDLAEDKKVHHIVAELMPEGWEGEGKEGREQTEERGAEAEVQGKGTGEIVGVAKWIFYAQERPAEEWDKPSQLVPADVPEGINEGAYEAFFLGLKDKRKKWQQGRPHHLLHILTTSPNHERLGAGSALVRWGTAHGDASGLECWLEATPTGYPVYRRAGFEDVDVLDVDVTPFGVKHGKGEDWGEKNALDIAGELPPGIFRTTIMQRKVGGPGGKETKAT